jgi:general secretion pathway protein D
MVCWGKGGGRFAPLALAACSTGPHANAKKQTFSSFDRPTDHAGQPPLPVGTLDFRNAELAQVLAIYQELAGRTVIHGAVPAPTITVRNQTPLNRIEALQLLDTVLAEHGIAMVLVGDNAVKAVQDVRASIEAPPEINRPWRELPDSGSFMTCSVRLKRYHPSELVAVLQPLVKTPNAILPIDGDSLMVLRDYSANIRRMLKLIEELEQNPGSGTSNLKH